MTLDLPALIAAGPADSGLCALVLEGDPDRWSPLRRFFFIGEYAAAAPATPRAAMPSARRRSSSGSVSDDSYVTTRLRHVSDSELDGPRDGACSGWTGVATDGGLATRITDGAGSGDSERAGAPPSGGDGTGSGARALRALRSTNLHRGTRRHGDQRARSSARRGGGSLCALLA